MGARSKSLVAICALLWIVPVPALRSWAGEPGGTGQAGGRAAAGSTASATGRILFITVDTLRADRLSCYGYKQLKTLSIDRLAADGILFSQAIAQVPLTLPSHSSIFTGTYPVFHGVRDQTGYFLPEERTTLAEMLQSRGYRTAAFISSFVLDGRFGLRQGFDHYDDIMDPGDASRRGRLERRGDRTLDRALAWMEGSGGDNFFVWIHLFDPHVPYAPPEPFRSRFTARPYDGEVAFVDSLVGKLLAFLDQKGWYESALIVFTSDHGEDLGDHGENTHGFFVYDSTIRVPLIIKAPRKEMAGRVVDTQVQTVDIAPTLLQMLALPARAEMQGRSVVSLAARGGGRPSPGLGETYYPYYHFGWSPLRFLRTGKYKFIEAPNPELYNLEVDPGERKNLFSRDSAVAQEMRNQLREALSRFGPRQAARIEAQRMDEQTLEKLRSLGYVGYAARRARTDPVDFALLPDPKEKLDIYNRLQSAILDEQNGRMDLAIRKFRELIRLDDTLVDAHLHLGLAYKRQQRYAEAIEEFRDALNHDSSNSIAAYNLAHSYALAGKLEEAKVGFERTLEIDPREVRAMVGLGLVHQMKGELRRAVNAYERALELSPTEPTALANLGAALLAQGATERAVATLRRALEADPRNAEAHNTLGSALLLRDNITEAEAHFREAVEINPRYAEAHANLGLALLKKGNAREGAVALRRAVEINPSFAQAHHLLGEAYAAQGMREAAEASFRTARKLGYP